MSPSWGTVPPIPPQPQFFSSTSTMVNWSTTSSTTSTVSLTWPYLTQNHASRKESSEHLNDTSPEVLFIERQMNLGNALDQLVGVSNNHDIWVSKKRRAQKLTVAVWIDRWRERLNPDS